MKFCSSCGHKLVLRIPQDDDRPRHICEQCDTIHYQNPRIIAGCLPVFEDKVLLCRRAIEPRQGYWTLPAGFMENAESVEQAALRESREEAHANITLHELYTLFSIPHINQVYMLFKGELNDLNFRAGSESLEVRLFTEEEIPWQQLAFPSIHKTLEYYFVDRKQQHYPLRSEVLTGKPSPPTNQ